MSHAQWPAWPNSWLNRGTRRRARSRWALLLAKMLLRNNPRPQQQGEKWPSQKTEHAGRPAHEFRLPPKKPSPTPQSGVNPGQEEGETPGRTYCHPGLHVARQKKSVLGLNALSRRDGDVSKHRLPRVGKICKSQSWELNTGSDCTPFSWRCQPAPFEMQKTLLHFPERCWDARLMAKGGFLPFFSIPSPMSQGTVPRLMMESQTGRGWVKSGSGSPMGWGSQGTDGNPWLQATGKPGLWVAGLETQELVPGKLQPCWCSPMLHRSPAATCTPLLTSPHARLAAFSGLTLPTRALPPLQVPQQCTRKEKQPRSNPYTPRCPFKTLDAQLPPSETFALKTSARPFASARQPGAASLPVLWSLLSFTLLF